MPACATYLRPPKRGLRVGGNRYGEGRARKRDSCLRAEALRRASVKFVRVKTKKPIPVFIKAPDAFS
jgi:hypothetical protein